MQFIGLELIYIISVSQYIVLAHAPRVDLVFKDNIAVLASGTYLLCFLLDLLCHISFLELAFPYGLDQRWSVEVGDVL